MNERFFRTAMGIAVAGRDRFWLATLAQLIRFENTLAPNQAVQEIFDACYVPREILTTGNVKAHDVGLLHDGTPIFVNTRYNCLSVPSPTRSFKPVWTPFFIDKLVDEDRCHLNGLAMEAGVPRYVTAISKSNTIDGWRDRRADGGVVMDVAENAVVCSNLSMPHSPRLHNGKLWLLNSGTGELGWVDVQAGKFEPVTFCPGFARGLAFCGNYALVGLSRPRYERFNGLELDDRLRASDSTPWCGVQVIDLESGSCKHWLRLDGAVQELYDVNILPTIRTPMTLGFQNNDLAALVVPDEMGALTDFLPPKT